MGRNPRLRVASEPLEAGKVGEETESWELALVSKGMGYLRNLKVILRQEQMAF